MAQAVQRINGGDQRQQRCPQWPAWFRTLALTCAALLATATTGQAADDPATTKQPDAPPNELRIAIIGDSTVCNFPDEHDCRGWGQYVQKAFIDGVQVTNLARSGRSTKTFRNSGLWKQTLDTRPNFVLIQFGHNDSHAPGKPESTDAATDFRDNLRQYIDEARKIGAQPILITPMHRRTFRDDGTLADILQPYADAMKIVAKEKQVPLVDLHTSSGALFRKLGEDGSAKLANRPGDRTHFNEHGAREMARLVLTELKTAAPDLNKWRTP